MCIFEPQKADFVQFLLHRTNDYWRCRVDAATSAPHRQSLHRDIKSLLLLGTLSLGAPSPEDYDPPEGPQSTESSQLVLDPADRCLEVLLY